MACFSRFYYLWGRKLVIKNYLAEKQIKKQDKTYLKQHKKCEKPGSFQ